MRPQTVYKISSCPVRQQIIFLHLTKHPSLHPWLFSLFFLLCTRPNHLSFVSKHDLCLLCTCFQSCPSWSLQVNLCLLSLVRPSQLVSLPSCKPSLAHVLLSQITPGARLHPVLHHNSHTSLSLLTTSCSTIEFFFFLSICIKYHIIKIKPDAKFTKTCILLHGQQGVIPPTWFGCEEEHGPQLCHSVT